MTESAHLPFLTNKLLAALPDDDYQRILPSLEVISLEIRQTLYELNEIIAYLYFPLSGMASILVGMGDGTLSEACVVGNEGFVGVPVFLGAEKTNTKSFYQIFGEAARLPREVALAEINRHGAFARVLQRYTLAYLSMLAQNSACNSQHTIRERCARWLLLTQDRAAENPFELTQEFLSQMLGVRRAGVSTVMQALQDTGTIRYSRGQITIIDRAALEETACECYGLITAEYNQMLTDLQ
jgi:CRP-like cAMP-binding protein